MNPTSNKADQIAGDLRRRISAGRQAWRPSDALVAGAEVPSIVQLMEIYTASRQTVVSAVRAVADGGLITRRVGRPHIVANPTPYFVVRGDAYDRGQRRDRGAMTTFEEQCVERGERGTTEHHPPIMGPVPGDVAARLELEGDGLHLSGEGHAAPADEHGRPVDSDRRCVLLYDTWVHSSVAELVTACWSTPGVKLYTLIESTGPMFAERSIEIYGRESTPEETGRFGWARPGTVFVEEYVGITTEDVPLVFDRNVRPFLMTRWSFTLSIRD